MKILTGHTSPDTAFVVADYPYGFRLRCKIRYWIEFKPKVGFRFMSQTTNPKREGDVWNKPKASTYYRFGGAMFLDDNEHVQYAGLSEYSGGAEATAWADKFGAGVPEVGRATLNGWVAAKSAYDTARQPGDALNVGIIEAHKAFVAAVTTLEPEGEGAVCSNCGYVKLDKTFQRDRCRMCNQSNIWKCLTDPK